MATWNVRNRTNETLLDTVTWAEFTSEEEDEILNEWPYFRMPAVTYISFILIITIAGLVGNVLSLIIMSDEKVNLFSYSVYLRWMAVSDTVHMITVISQDIINHFGDLDAVELYHIAICKGWNYVRMVTVILSPWLVVALTVDRFVCVVFPLSRTSVCSRSKAINVCAVLTLVCLALSVGELVMSTDVDGRCDTPDNRAYIAYITFQVLFTATSCPCLIILIFNIYIVIKINKGRSFRQHFQSSNTKKEKQDKSTIPLILISVFAFVTLLPASITDIAEYLLLAKYPDSPASKLAGRLWPFFNLIYLLNFAQNFYILMASSKQYRQIIAHKMKCLKLKNFIPSKLNSSGSTSSKQIPSISPESTELGL